MSKKPNFAAIIASVFAAVSWLGWISEHNRAEKLRKELKDQEGQQR
jgi:hypothetical protein